MAAAQPKHKQASFNKKVAADKKPIAVADPTAYLDLRPTWRLSLLEMCPPYGWHEIPTPTVHSIHGRLRSFESMTWREILHPANVKKSQNHFMPVSEICDAAIQRLAEIGQADIDQLMSLRVSKKERVWGIMDQEVCSLVFWDPFHGLYEINVTDN